MFDLKTFLHSVLAQLIAFLKMEGRRDKRISRSIVYAILWDDEAADKRFRIWRPLRTFFRLYGLVLTRQRPELFRNLRVESWNLSDDEYRSSFKDADCLLPKGDMGYSGSVSCLLAFDIYSQTNSC
jgi:hypothetical protein